MQCAPQSKEYVCTKTQGENTNRVEQTYLILIIYCYV